MLKVITLAILYFLWVTPVAAETNFGIEFVPETLKLNSNGEIILLTNTSEDIDLIDYKVKPNAPNNVAGIFDTNSNFWLLGNSPWERLPTLDKNLKIKFINPPQEKITLKMEILHIPTAKIYETDELTIFNKNPTYFQKINDNITSFETSKITDTNTPVVSPEHASNTTAFNFRKNKIHLPFALFAYSISFVAGYRKYPSKMVKWLYD